MIIITFHVNMKEDQTFVIPFRVVRQILTHSFLNTNTQSQYVITFNSTIFLVRIVTTALQLRSVPFELHKIMKTFCTWYAFVRTHK